MQLIIIIVAMLAAVVGTAATSTVAKTNLIRKEAEGKSDRQHDIISKVEVKLNSEDHIERSVMEYDTEHEHDEEEEEGEEAQEAEDAEEAGDADEAEHADEADEADDADEADEADVADEARKAEEAEEAEEAADAEEAQKAEEAEEAAESEEAEKAEEAEEADEAQEGDGKNKEHGTSSLLQLDDGNLEHAENHEALGLLSRAEMERHAGEVFREYDVDQSGLLEEDEVQRLVETNNSHWRTFDTEGAEDGGPDGKLSMAELLRSLYTRPEEVGEQEATLHKEPSSKDEEQEAALIADRKSAQQEEDGEDVANQNDKSSYEDEEQDGALSDDQHEAQQGEFGENAANQQENLSSYDDEQQDALSEDQNEVEVETQPQQERYPSIEGYAADALLIGGQFSGPEE